jgi:hypothetical protein
MLFFILRPISSAGGLKTCCSDIPTGCHVQTKKRAISGPACNYPSGVNSNIIQLVVFLTFPPDLLESGFKSFP